MSSPITSSTSMMNNSMPSSQPLVLQEGQMVHGQIKQLYPGQTAEIQIGNQAVVAKLEVPMRAGDSYYFQVQSVHPEIQLKVISGPTTAESGKTQQLQTLIEAMNLPKSTEMTQVLQAVLKNKIPMTREQLIQAEQLLKNVPQAARTDALVAIQKVVSLKLPLTTANFQAVMGVQSKDGLHQHIQQLQTMLQTELGPNTAALTQALQSLSKPFAQTTEQTILAQALHQIMDPSATTELKFSALQLLKSATILPNHASLANIHQILGNVAQTMNPNSSLAIVQQLNQNSQPITQAQNAQIQQLIAADTTLTTGQKKDLQTLLQQATNASTVEATKSFVRTFTQMYTQAQATNVMTQPFQSSTEQGLIHQLSQQTGVGTANTLLQLAETSRIPTIQNIVQQAEQVVANAVNGNAIKDALQSIFRSLGINYEAALLARDVNVSTLMDSVKPQLLALLQDPAISQQTKSQAEFLVNRFNGTLLTSGDQGLQHQLIMQVPLDFFGKKIDATLQWSGRMKENDKIDPDYARILFYLDLAAIDKTIVDMQVQNRVVSITVFNELPQLKNLAAPLLQKLQEGLQNIDYRLSGVFFKPYTEQQVERKISNAYEPISEQGVDYRI